MAPAKSSTCPKRRQMSSPSKPVFRANTEKGNNQHKSSLTSSNYNLDHESGLQRSRSHLGTSSYHLELQQQQQQQYQQQQRSPSSHFNNFGERPLSFASSTHSSDAAAQQLQLLQPQGTLLPGTVVSVNGNMLVVEKFLAEGGFAHVYLVSSGNGLTKLVLKRISCPDQASLNELIQEAQRQLSGHECIVDFFDFSYNAMSQGGGGFELMILMEYCQGGPLVDYLNSRLDNRPSHQEVLTIFTQISSAVCHMHSQSPSAIIHRDIKIENVLLSDTRFKLCDFGSCTREKSPPNTFLSIQEIRRLEDEISRLTTLQYRAPEMCDLYQKKGLGEKVDIWALGVLLYKLCYYTTPFEESGKMAIMNGSFSFPSHPTYSDDIKNFICTMLQVDVDARPDIFQVYYHACTLTNTPYPLSNIPRPIQFNAAHSRGSSPEHQQQLNLFAGDGPFKTITKNSSQSDLSGLNITPMRRGRPSAKKGNSGATVDAGESMVNLASPIASPFPEPAQSSNSSAVLGFSNDPFTVALNQGGNAGKPVGKFSNSPPFPPQEQQQQPQQQQINNMFPNNYTNNAKISMNTRSSSGGQGSTPFLNFNGTGGLSPFQQQPSQQLFGNTMQFNSTPPMMMNPSQSLLMNQGSSQSFASGPQMVSTNGNILPNPPPKPLHLQQFNSAFGTSGGQPVIMNSTQPHQQQQLQQPHHQQQYQQQFQQQAFGGNPSLGGIPPMQMQHQASFNSNNGVGMGMPPMSFNMGATLQQQQTFMMMQNQQQQPQGGGLNGSPFNNGNAAPPPKPPRQGRSPFGANFPQ